MERLKLKNFGPVSDLDIELKKVNVFIGEQGVGKSTIAKVLSCVRDTFMQSRILAEESTDKIFSFFERFKIKSYFNEDTYIEYQSSSELILKYENERFSVTHPSLEKEGVEKMLLENINKNLRNNALILNLLEKKEEELSEIFKKNRDLIFSNLRNSFYLPAERGLAGCFSSSIASMMLSKVPFPDTLMAYLSFFEKAKKEYPDYEIPFLNLSFLSQDNKEMISIGDGKNVPFEECSSGIQSIVPLLMVIDYCLQQECFDSFALEEPELNLFPSNQLALMRRLISKMNEDNGIKNLVLTTHSPYLLSILNVSILAGKITALDAESTTSVSSILPSEYHLKTSDIGVFSLGKKINGTSYCEDIIDETTGLIQANYLDVVSEIISSDFNQLQKVYLKALRSGKK